MPRIANIVNDIMVVSTGWYHIITLKPMIISKQKVDWLHITIHRMTMKASLGVPIDY